MNPQWIIINCVISKTTDVQMKTVKNKRIRESHFKLKTKLKNWTPGPKSNEKQIKN